MRRVLLFSLLFVTLLSALLVTTANAAPAQPTALKRVVGYFADWDIYGRNYLVKNIDTSGSASRLTTINYAFGNVAPDANGNITCQIGDAWADYDIPFTAAQTVDGTDDTWGEPLRGNFKQIKELKAKYPNLKVVISLGGWSWSSYFTKAAESKNRVAFVKSCIDLFIKGDLPPVDGAGGTGSGVGVFDGIDIDWEYPGACGNTCDYKAADTANFTGLIMEFRKQLNAYQRGMLLTIAAPAGRPKAAKINLAAISPHLNWINVMTYDYHGTWETTTNFNSPLYSPVNDPGRLQALNINDTVNYYLMRGVPASKLVLGVPFYGKGWTGVPSGRNGLYQPATGAAPGQFEAGTGEYKWLKGLLSTGYTRYWNNWARDAWLYNSSTQTFWTYDDPQVMKTRVNYINSRALGGIMFWEIAGDTDDGELVHALVP